MSIATSCNREAVQARVRASYHTIPEGRNVGEVLVARHGKCVIFLIVPRAETTSAWLLRRAAMRVVNDTGAEKVEIEPNTMPIRTHDWEVMIGRYTPTGWLDTRLRAVHPAALDKIVDTKQKLTTIPA